MIKRNWYAAACDSCSTLASEQQDLNRRFESNPQQIPPRKVKLDPSQADMWRYRDSRPFSVPAPLARACHLLKVPWNDLAFFLEKESHFLFSFPLQRRAMSYSEFILPTEAYSTYLGIHLKETHRVSWASLGLWGPPASRLCGHRERDQGERSEARPRWRAQGHSQAQNSRFAETSSCMHLTNSLQGKSVPFQPLQSEGRLQIGV